MKPKPPLERDVQRRVVAVYRTVGCIVWSLSQGYRPGGPRHATTRQSKGLPDLYVMCPVRDGIRRLVFWHEVKRPGGKQTPEQMHFQIACELRGIGYVLGGMPEAVEALADMGFGVLKP